MGWAFDVDLALGAWELVIFIFRFFCLYLDWVESPRENLAMVDIFLKSPRSSELFRSNERIAKMVAKFLDLTVMLVIYNGIVSLEGQFHIRGQDGPVG